MAFYKVTAGFRLVGVGLAVFAVGTLYPAYSASAAPAAVPEREKQASAYASPPPSRLLWGEMHLHTKLSVDAAGKGNLFLGLDEAYRFAKGGSVTAANGDRVQLRRPLDFMVITDHAVNLGVIDRIRKNDPMILSTAVGQRWSKSIIGGDGERIGEYLTSKDKTDLVAFQESTSLGKDVEITPNHFFWDAWFPEPGSRVYETDKEQFDSL